MRELQVVRENLGSRFSGCELTGAKPALDAEVSPQVIWRFYDHTVA